MFGGRWNPNRYSRSSVGRSSGESCVFAAAITVPSGMPLPFTRTEGLVPAPLRHSVGVQRPAGAAVREVQDEKALVFQCAEVTLGRRAADPELVGDLGGIDGTSGGADRVERFLHGGLQARCRSGGPDPGRAGVVEAVNGCLVGG